MDETTSPRPPAPPAPVPGHDHDHDHGHDHEHDRAGGLLGWLSGLYGHGHDPHERVDEAMASHEEGIRALKVSLVGLALTAAIQVVIVVYSGSVALLADTIHNFGDAATSIPLWIAFAFARRPPNRRYTYGYGKIEDVAGVIIVMIILFSAAVAGYEAVRRFLYPQEVQHLGWVAAAALAGFLGNEAVAVYRIRVGRKIGSAALIADGQHSRVDGFTSLAVLIGVIGVWVGLPILDPLVGIGITIAILVIVRDAARSVVYRLLDGVDPEVLAEIEHAPWHVPGVRGVHHVRARWTGHKVHTDLHIAVDPALSVREAHAIVDGVERALWEHVRTYGSAVIHVCPAAASDSTPHVDGAGGGAGAAPPGPTG